MSLSVDKTPISFYVNECTRDQMIMRRLINEVSDLRKELAQRNAEGIMKHPQFLQRLVDQSQKSNSGQRLTYSDHLKQVSLYIYMLAGPMAYEIHHKNLPLPSAATMKRQLGKETPVQEGVFQLVLFCKLEP